MIAMKMKMNLPMLKLAGWQHVLTRPHLHNFASAAFRVSLTWMPYFVPRNLMIFFVRVIFDAAACRVWRLTQGSKTHLPWQKRTGSDGALTP